MKVCKRCKTGFKDEYLFCPRCGTPYDAEAAARTPKGIGAPSAAASVFAMIGRVILYIIGSIIVLFSVLVGSFSTTSILSTILGVLLGVSFFPFVYSWIASRPTKIGRKAILVARIVLPIVLFIIWVSTLPQTTVSDDANADPQTTEITAQSE